jgi:hypothetical protein
MSKLPSDKGLCYFTLWNFGLSGVQHTCSFMTPSPACWICGRGGSFLWGGGEEKSFNHRWTLMNTNGIGFDWIGTVNGVIKG